MVDSGGNVAPLAYKAMKYVAIPVLREGGKL
jgi:hypothetical protein